MSLMPICCLFVLLSSFTFTTAIRPFCVGYKGDHVGRIGKCEDAVKQLECDEATGVFYASDVKKPGMEAYAVGYTSGNTWRNNLVKGETTSGSGWSQYFTFYAYSTQVPGTVPIAVGYALNSPMGLKYQFLIGKDNAGGGKWTHYLVFYATISNYTPDQVVQINVCTYETRLTYKVTKGVPCEDNMWKYSFTFPALTVASNGTMPIAVGSAGRCDKYRSRVSKGLNAGDMGWTHEFAVYVFENAQPGTIPIAVGYADFTKNYGWKYKIVENQEDSSDGEWTHSFTFYVPK